MSWEFVSMKPGVCERCGQGYCIERRKGEANADDPESPQVLDVACRICGCMYDRQKLGVEHAA